jgi:hypothetical protein
MPHSQCPNIKNDILALRSRIGELKGLKILLFQDYPAYEESFEKIQDKIAELIISIDKKIDTIANEVIRTLIIKGSGGYKYVHFCRQGRIRVTDFNDNWFHVSLDGTPAYDSRFETVDEYFEDRARVKDNYGKWFHIDRYGNPAYDSRFQWVDIYSKGRAGVKDFNDNEFQIDLDGNRILD